MNQVLDFNPFFQAIEKPESNNTLVIAPFGPNGSGKTILSSGLSEQAQAQKPQDMEISIYGDDRVRAALITFVREATLALETVRQYLPAGQKVILPFVMGLTLDEYIEILRMFPNSTHQQGKTESELLKNYISQSNIVGDALYNIMARTGIEEKRKVVYFCPCINFVPGTRAYSTITRTFKVISVFLTYKEETMKERIKAKCAEREIDISRYNFKNIMIIAKYLEKMANAYRIPILYTDGKNPEEVQGEAYHLLVKQIK